LYGKKLWTPSLKPGKVVNNGNNEVHNAIFLEISISPIGTRSSGTMLNNAVLYANIIALPPQIT
jgi:hypothetical protein